MKNLLLIPAMVLLCVGCNSNDSGNSKDSQMQENSADWTITTKVKSAILADTSISASARLVSVSTTNGVVTLTGTVSTKEDRDRIVKLVKNIDGVQKVD